MKNPEPKLFKKLIEGCAKGDRVCQQKIFEALYGKMMGVCLRYISDREEAKDVLQDGFIKVFGNISRYDHSGSFEGWVRRIIVNTAIDQLRRNKNIFQSMDNELALNNLSEEPLEEEASMYPQLKTSEVMEAIQRLSPAYRTVFNLYVIEGYNHQQIADTLGISVGASKSNLSKAKQNLQKYLLQKISQYN